MDLSEQLIEMYLAEKATKGMNNAYRELARKNPAHTCPQCGLVIPKYPGRYPEKCPECGTPLKEKSQKQMAYGSQATTKMDMRQVRGEK
jgi:rubrerythrin